MADAQLNTAEHEGDGLCMPHLVYSREELDRQHPRMEVPEEELLDESLEVEADRKDAVLQHGLSIAEKISADMKTFGRTKRTPQHMSPAETPDGQESNGSASGGRRRNTQHLRRKTRAEKEQERSRLPSWVPAAPRGRRPRPAYH